MIMDNHLCPIDILLLNTTTNNNLYLNKIKQHAIMLLKINNIVKSLLPEQLRPWCRVANIRQGVMILETANASWMMRLRYEKKNYYLLYVLIFYHHCLQSTYVLTQILQL